MATIKVIDLLNSVKTILQDTGAVRYSNDNLLKFFNDGQREVVLHRPDANVASATFACATGSKQSLPAAALRLIDVVRNVNGQAVSQVEKQMLDQNLPDWHEQLAGSNGIEHFVYETTDPKNFYVFPKAVSGTHSIEIVYSTIPADIAIANFSTSTNVIGLDDVYANCLADYTLYRAYQIDSDEGNVSRSAMHFQAFAQSLGIKTRSDAASSPRPIGGSA
ncbi:MAG: hypothetical protein CL504_09545 [Actinobacteria bacterium]|nr:hypothetical protein [Actinomycetota bacterium]